MSGSWSLSNATGYGLFVILTWGPDIVVVVLSCGSEGWRFMMKDDEEHLLPDTLRATFRQITDAFVDGDYELRRHFVEGVAPIPTSTAEHMADNVLAYGDGLAPLNDATWERSVYRWMDGYWQVLVDLTTASEPVSDLTLHAKVFAGEVLRVEVDSIHVP